MDDEDEWVGIPPEGRHSSDRADPAFWRSHWPPAGIGLVVVLLVLAVIVLAR